MEKVVIFLVKKINDKSVTYREVIAKYPGLKDKIDQEITDKGYVIDKNK